jgi:hypothetical protein
MKTWLLYILTLNAQTGDLIDSQQEGEAMTAEACVKAREGKISVAKDGKFQMWICFNGQTYTKTVML